MQPRAASKILLNTNMTGLQIILQFKHFLSPRYPQGCTASEAMHKSISTARIGRLPPRGQPEP